LSDGAKHLPLATAPQSAGAGPRRIGDIWQWLGISGDAIGTGGVLRRTFFYSFAVTAVISGAFNTLNVISILHGMPHLSWIEPLIWEGSSWLTLILFFWIPWIAYRLAPPPGAQPRWRLAIHLPAMLAYSLFHVSGFVALRVLAYRALGATYVQGDFLSQFFPYELSKDALGYLLFIAGFTLIEHLLRQQQLIETPGQSLTFDIRDGARLTRVRLSQILAITAAGNYVEFALEDGRKLLMRSALGSVESDLAPRGFVRTHRSWLVNTARVTGLTPDGSGDYTVTVAAVKAPLSRRFPAALARLRQPD
jgi:DNA-binding LytR/AlgR family response regulator